MTELQVWLLLLALLTQKKNPSHSMLFVLFALVVMVWLPRTNSRYHLSEVSFPMNSIESLVELIVERVSTVVEVVPEAAERRFELGVGD